MIAVCVVQVIARVGGLTLLNGSDIHRYERRDSELQYLRRTLGMPDATAASCISCLCSAGVLYSPGIVLISDLSDLCALPGDLEALADGEQRAALQRDNPRLAELAKKYGMMTGLTASNGMTAAGSSGQGGGRALGSTTLRLRLTVSTGNGGEKTVTKRLPGADHALRAPLGPQDSQTMVRPDIYNTVRTHLPWSDICGMVDMSLLQHSQSSS